MYELRRLYRCGLCAASLCAALFSFIHQATADTVLEVTTTDPPPFQAGTFGPWGGRAGQVGQTLIVPAADHVLTGFSLTALGIEGSPSNVWNVQAHVVQWSNATHLPTGPILYSSSEVSMPSVTTQTLNFNVGALDLAPGGTYVLFLNAKLPSNAGHDVNGANPGFLSARDDNPYSGGRWVFAYMNFNDVSNANWNTWDDNAIGVDLAFRATFAPEPSSLAVLGLLARLGQARLHRR